MTANDCIDYLMTHGKLRPEHLAKMRDAYNFHRTRNYMEPTEAFLAAVEDVSEPEVVERFPDYLRRVRNRAIETV